MNTSAKIAGLWLALSSALSPSAVSAATSVTLSDINGGAVEVLLSEVQKAYFEIFAPFGQNHQIPNGDGSISILNPVFDYAGKKISFRVQLDNVGVCKYFGFVSSHGYEAMTVKGPLVMAEMDRDGTLGKIYHDPYTYDHDLIKVVVCSNRE